jgi:divalent metal cation (Fe/Co/Zn/Cd) transporter
LVALGAIVGSYLGLPFLDPVGGILVAGMIMKNGFEIMLSSLKELADMKVEEDVIIQVEKAVEKSKVIYIIRKFYIIRIFFFSYINM